MSPSPGARRMTLKLEGRAFEIEIDDPGTSPIEVTVDGKSYRVEVEATRQEAAPIAVSPPRAPVAGQPSAAAPVSVASAPVYSAREIRAPMPGNILNIMVAPGDAVEVGQPLCALEAMKMKSAIRSPRPGVIAAVHVSEGQVVTHAELLFSFE